MTQEEHKEVHETLHSSLDQLVADFILHNPKERLQSTTIMELIRWSHRQTIEPEITRP